MRLSGFLALGTIAGILMAAGAPTGDAFATGAPCKAPLPAQSQSGNVAGGKACGAEDAEAVAAEPAKAPPSAGRQASRPPGLGKLSDAGFFTGLGAFLATKGVDASVPARNLEEMLPVSP
jgi:hypothetical protein